jgi:hypothetical protein
VTVACPRPIPLRIGLTVFRSQPFRPRHVFRTAKEVARVARIGILTRTGKMARRVESAPPECPPG